MAKIAVIKTGGKQYLVKAGDTLKVEKLAAEAGKNFTFDKILLVAEDSGAEMKIGNPEVAGAKAEAEILEQGRAKKVNVVHYKSKTRHHKVYGHRQPFTKVKIEKI
ncbi:MAG: 50S ribosomal protein L21 [Patescibacteria group bacterium]|nr:50S ribosomal protein L21 [Patescibacteria group bacterium]